MPEGQSKDDHVTKIVKGGGSTKGRMPEGQAKDDHVTKIVEKKGGSTKGRMTEGQAKDDHVEAGVEKGASKKGPMTDADLDAHCAAIAEGLKKANALLFRVANGTLKQGPKWTVSCHYKGTNGSGVIYTFINGSGDSIKGKRNFEEYLIKNFVSEQLTEDGKSALEAMMKKRVTKDTKKAKRKNAN
jgi:hypothetical protein